MGSASSAPPVPDTSKYSDAAYAEGQKASGWADEMWQTGQQEWGKLQNYTSEMMGAAMPAMEDMFGWASEARDFYNTKVVPQVQSLFTEAETYASKGEEDRQRATAIQDVNQAVDANKAAHLRRLKSYGADPTDLSYAALDKQTDIAKAAAQALAANQAGERTKQIGRDLRTQAIGVGQDMASQANQATQGAAGVGAQTLGAATGAAVGGSQIGQAAIPFSQTAMQGYDLGAGIVDTAYGRELQKTEIDNAAAQQNFNNMMAVGQSVGQMGAMVADGGAIIAPGGPTDDAGAVAISDGEYVVPADVVRKLGTNHFDKLIEKETGRPPPEAKAAIPIDPGTAPLPQGITPSFQAPAGVLQ